MAEERGLVLLLAIVALAAWAATTPPIPLELAQNAPGLVTQQQPDNAPTEQNNSRLNSSVKNDGDASDASNKGGTEPIAKSYTDALLALFTLFLVLVGAIQAVLLRQQIYFTFKPHLTARNIWSPDAEMGKPIRIQLEIINNGSATTRIRASRFKLYYVEPGQTYHALGATAVKDKNVIGGKKLVPGAVWRGTFKPRDIWHSRYMAIGLLEAEGLFLGGKVLYRDKLGNQHRLGFFRRFNPATKRFERLRTNVEDYEYDD